MHKSLSAALLAGLILGVPALAQAQTAYATRLDRLKETRILVAAYRETSLPFSYLNNGKPTGFGVELTERIAAGLRRQLDTPDLRIRWNAVTLSTRIPMMTTGTVDLACATDSNTWERQKLVGFSLNFLVSENGAAVARNSELRQLTDLRGKRVAVAANSTGERYLSDLNTRQGADITAVVTRSNAEAMHQLRAGKADAYLNGSSIVAGELFHQPDADRYTIIGGSDQQEAFACLLPKDDQPFKQAVDRVLREMMASGDMEALYNKWFTQPIPPFGKSLDLPLNDATRRLYAAPSDQPLP